MYTYILHHGSYYRLIIFRDHWSSPSTAAMTLKLVTVLIPSRNIRAHNPQFSRSIIYNVITVGLTGHSSCSPPCVASIKFWLVNDCLFFAGHMESAVYSLSLYSHWLTLATDAGTVIVLYCWCAPWHIATHRVVFPNGCNLLFFLKIIVNLFFFILQPKSWRNGTESRAKFDPVTYSYLGCAAVFCNLSLHTTFPTYYDPIHHQSSLMYTQENTHIYSIRPGILKIDPSLCHSLKLQGFCPDTQLLWELWPGEGLSLRA